MEYPPRPDPVGICKCGHKYQDHKVTWKSETLMESKNYFTRVWGFMLSCGILDNFERIACYDCMCPQYQQEKIVDGKTGIEIQKLEIEKQ